MVQNATAGYPAVGAREILLGQLRGVVENYALGLILPLVLASIVIAAFSSRQGKSRQPPSLIDPIPFVFNTLQFVLRNETFMNRAKKALKATNLAKFYLGTKPVYLVSGPKNVQTIFGRSQNINNEGIMLSINLPTWYRFSKRDLQRFAEDKSGRGRNPLPGSENVPQEQRYFFGYEHVHSAFLAKAHHLNPLVEHYHDQFAQLLDEYPAGEWKTLSVKDFSKREVTSCAVDTLIGPKALELNSDFCDLLADFDHAAFSLAMKIPKWLYPSPYKAHEKYLTAVQKYLDCAWAEFDWNDKAATEAPWEPHFGAQVSREIVKWFKDCGFNGKDTGAGALGILVWAGTSNVIPIMTWMIMELAKDPSLFQALREEVNTAQVIDPQTGSRTLDIHKVVLLPLLTSAYTEALRLSMSFNVVRNVTESLTIDGYTLEKGALVQVPTLAAHYDEDVWGFPGHPASEFWAERHIKYAEEKDEAGNVRRKRTFAMAGRTGADYFPYGGGNLICPGRHFAKQQIMLTVALLVFKMDVEFVQWTKLDGSPSDRPARNQRHFCGTGSAPPDRDMKIRIRPTVS
ncbi:hypothetical protein DL768_010720 [Monosporascus sp. mg162]|nr:hypothetical protein DL768_010720 [Monosporascus sp. mg162]